MLKTSGTGEDEMRTYYSYIKTLLHINNNLICESPDKELILVRI